MTRHAASAEQLFPLALVCEDEKMVLSRRGVLTCGWELTLPAAYSVSGERYDEMLLGMESAIKRLPCWCVVHRQDTFLRKRWDEGTDDVSFLARCNAEHFRGREYLEHRSFLFVSLGDAALFSRSGRSSGIKGIQGMPGGIGEHSLADFQSKCAEFASVLATGSNYSLRELTKEDWLGQGSDPGIIQRYMMLGGEGSEMSDIEVAPDHIRVGEKRAVAFSISESDLLPAELDSTTCVDALSGPGHQVRLGLGAKMGVLLDCEHIINQIIVVPAQAKTLSDLDAKRRRMVSGFSSTDNRINSQEIEDYLTDVYKGGILTVKAHMNIIAWTQGEDTRDLQARLSAALTSMGVTSSRSLHAMPVLWYAGVPSMASDIGRENLMLMELRSALALSLMESYDRGVEDPSGRLKPVFRTTDRMRRIPLALDTQMLAQRLGRIDNYNAFVLGPSGTGKSYWMNSYVRSCYDAGEHVFIIDVGDSYQGLCSVIAETSGGADGQYESFDMDHPLSFAPFPGMAGWFDDAGALSQDEPGVEFMLSVLRTAWSPQGGWTARRGNILSHILTLFLQGWDRESGREPLFDDLFCFIRDEVAPRICYVSPYSIAPAAETYEKARERQALLEADIATHAFIYAGTAVGPDAFDVKDFLQTIGAYARGGRFGFLLNDPSPKDMFASRFVVFEVDGLKDIDKGGPFFPLCILCIMHAFDSKMRRNVQDFKVMVIEEAWSAISCETMSPYIKSLYKTSRKFSTSVMTVTQEIADILSSPLIRETIVQNSSVKVLLDQSSNALHFEQVSQYMGLSPMDCNLIFSMGRLPNPYSPAAKDVFIKLGAATGGVYCTEVSREEALCYESNKEKKRPLLERAQQLGSIIEAIKERTQQHET